MGRSSDFCWGFDFVREEILCIIIGLCLIVGIYYGKCVKGGSCYKYDFEKKLNFFFWCGGIFY